MRVEQTDDEQQEQMGVDEHAARSIASEKLLDVVTHVRRSGSSWP